MAEFTFQQCGYMQAVDDYRDVLSTIFDCETGKRPKYKELASMCASMIAKRYLETDGYYDEQALEDVEKFYADKFPQIPVCD